MAVMQQRQQPALSKADADANMARATVSDKLGHALDCSLCLPWLCNMSEQLPICTISKGHSMHFGPHQVTSGMLNRPKLIRQDCGTRLHACPDEACSSGEHALEMMQTVHVHAWYKMGSDQDLAAYVLSHLALRHPCCWRPVAWHGVMSLCLCSAGAQPAA